MGEHLLAAAKLKLTVEMNEDVLLVKWNRLSTTFLFHDGYGALLRHGTGATAGMVELHRVRVGDDPEAVGHVEPLIPAS